MPVTEGPTPEGRDQKFRIRCCLMLLMQEAQRQFLVYCQNRGAMVYVPGNIRFLRPVPVNFAKQPPLVNILIPIEFRNSGDSIFFLVLDCAQGFVVLKSSDSFVLSSEQKNHCLTATPFVHGYE